MARGGGFLTGLAALVSQGSCEPKAALQENCKKVVDELESHPYMAPPATAAALDEVRYRFASLLSRYNRCPEPNEPGEDTRRLFDIVGLDEGTCGRRPGHR